MIDLKKECKKDIIEQINNRSTFKYSENTKNGICQLEKDGDNFNYTDWGNFYGKYQNNSYVTCAIIQHKNVPMFIVNQIIKNTLQNYDVPINPMKNEILFRGLYFVLSDENINQIWEKLGTSIFVDMSKFRHQKTNEAWATEYPFPEKVTEALCGFAMKSKANRKQGIENLPFYYLKSDDYAKMLLDNKRCDETVRTCIASNPYLSDEVRNRAYNEGIIPMEIRNFTDYMMEDMYSIAAETYTEMKLNPYTKNNTEPTKEEMTAFRIAEDFLNKVIYNKMLPESMQLDLMHRLQEIATNDADDNILYQLFQSTESSEVLKNIYSFRRNDTTEFAFSNPHMPKELLKKRMDELVEKTKRNRKIPSVKGTGETVLYAIKNIPLDDAQYDILLKYSDIYNNKNIVRSIHIPDKYLDQIIDKSLPIIENIEKHGNTNNNYIYQTHTDIVRVATLNKVLKGVFKDSKEFDYFCRCIKNDLTTAPKPNVEKINEKWYKSAEKLLLNMKGMDEKKRNAIIEKIKNSINEYEGQQKTFLQSFSAKTEKIKDILECEKKGDYSMFDSSTLEKIFMERVHNFLINYEFKPIELYKNIDALLKDVLPVFSELKKQEMIEFEQQKQETDINR